MCDANWSVTKTSRNHRHDPFPSSIDRNSLTCRREEEREELKDTHNACVLATRNPEGRNFTCFKWEYIVGKRDRLRFPSNSIYRERKEMSSRIYFESLFRRLQLIDAREIERRERKLEFYSKYHFLIFFFYSFNLFRKLYPDLLKKYKSLLKKKKNLK